MIRLLLLAALASLTSGSDPLSKGPGLLSVSLIVAAYGEEDVIAAKVANAKALDYAGEMEVIVAVDGFVTLRLQLAVPAVNCAVAPSTTTVAPT